MTLCVNKGFPSLKLQKANSLRHSETLQSRFAAICAKPFARYSLCFPNTKISYSCLMPSPWACTLPPSGFLPLTITMNERSPKLCRRQEPPRKPNHRTHPEVFLRRNGSTAQFCRPYHKAADFHAEAHP